MDHVELSRLRNVVLAGHAGSGKTTLAEHLLFTSGAMSGSVGSTTERRASTSSPRSRSASCRSRSPSPRSSTTATAITLVDTPGYADFIGEVVEGFAGGRCRADHHGRVRRRRSRHRDGDPARATDTARRRCSCSPSATARTPTRPPPWMRCAATFGSKIAPLQIAIGKAETFRGYVDLVHRKSFTVRRRARSPRGRSPPTSRPSSSTRRDQLLEAAAEADDDVLTKYLEGEDISDAELEACLHKGVRESILAPVLITSASARHRHDRAARGDRQVPAVARRGAAGHGT